MKRTQLEEKVTNYIEKHLDIIIFIVIFLLSLFIRYSLRKFETTDYKFFLLEWYNDLKAAGGFRGLKTYTGDYNMPYVTILAFLTYIKFLSPITAIKLVSIFFDYLLSFITGYIVYDFVKDKSKKIISALVSGIVMIMLPTMMLNGSMWGQCDVIYTTFIVLSLFYLMKEKYTKSFISLGVAFAFKLQFMFILPVYIIYYFKKKKFSILNFLIIPLVNIVLCIPAMLCGRPIIDCINVYFNQTQTYNKLTMNMPNIYTFFSGGDELATIGLVMTIFALGMMFWYIVRNKNKLTNELLLLLSVWSVSICVYLLPRMHDRYLFAADILSVIYVLLYKRNYFVALGIQYISLYSYVRFMLKDNPVPSVVNAAIFTAIIIYLTIDFVKKYKLEGVKEYEKRK